MQAQGASIAPTPSKVSSARRRWAILFVSLGLITSVVLAAVGLIALGLAGWQYTADQRDASTTPQRGALSVETTPSGAEIFVGPERIGLSPCVVPAERLGGRPIIAVSPNHEPQILRAERIEDLTRAGDQHVELVLQPSAIPSIALYVEFNGQGLIYSHEGAGVLGAAPGVIRLPAQASRALTLVDDASGAHIPFDASSCRPGTLCTQRVGLP